MLSTLIRVPPHSDFEQGTGHFHDEVEELKDITYHGDHGRRDDQLLLTLGH